MRLDANLTIGRDRNVC